MRRMRMWMGVALLVVLVTPAVGGSFDQWLPESTIVYVSVEDVTGLCTRVKASPLADLWAEEAVQEFLELPRQKWAEMMEEAAGELGGARPDEMLAMLKGQYAFAFTGIRKTEEKNVLGFVLMADVGENGAKVTEWLARIENSDKFPHRRVESEFRGTKIVTWVEAEDEDEGDEQSDEPVFEPGPPCYFVDGNVLAFASDRVALEGILDRKSAEDAQSLADNEIYRTVRRRTGPNADLVLFANLEQVWKIIDDTVVEDTPMVGTVLDALGLTGVKGVGGRMSMSATGSTSHLYAYAPGEMTGLMKLFAGANSALVPPKFVPADVASAMTMVFDFQALWAETRRVMDKIQPGLTQQMDQQLEALKEQIGVDIQADLIGSLGSKMTYYQLPVDPDAEPDPTGMGPGRIVMGLEVTNAEKFDGALEQILQMAGGMIPIENRDYMGVTIHVVNAGFFEMGFATTAGHFILATNVEDLERVIQTQGKDVAGLAGSEDFQRALAGLPADRSMVTYSDPRKAMATLSQMLKTMGPMLIMQNPEMADWIDLSLFPGAEVFTKYMDVSGGVMTTEEDGISIQGISRMKSQR